MILPSLAFYMFAFITVACGVLVIASRNPVHSVLFLILAFFNSAGLFVLMGAEFLAMILIIVYVGAVAVLFMFVVMMLDINFVELRQGFLQYMPIGLLVGFVLLIEILMVVGTWVIAPEMAGQVTALTPDPAVRQNVAAIGDLVYTRYVYLFQAAGMVLLVAMIGAIVLTLRKRGGVRRQDIGRQTSRPRAASVEVRKVQPGQGV
ncbi:MAG: NADH-quinone oxidoreductase subunit J [Pseudomonadota bacterium]|nr:NADH-quinone oxidoreductase subunit J [Pseudomonadota bacterium]